MFMAMSQLSDRLRSAREAAGFKRAVHAAESLGVKTPTYIAHENGGRTPDVDALAHYSRRFRVSIDWLVTGKTKGINEMSVKLAASALFSALPREALVSLEPDALAETMTLLCKAIDDNPGQEDVVANVVHLFAQRQLAS